jgi:hypothetical protein
VLSDIVTAVINGSDGCVFCFGHAQLGKCDVMMESFKLLIFGFFFFILFIDPLFRDRQNDYNGGLLRRRYRRTHPDGHWLALPWHR